MNNDTPGHEMEQIEILQKEGAMWFAALNAKDSPVYNQANARRSNSAPEYDSSKLIERQLRFAKTRAARFDDAMACFSAPPI